MRENRPVAATNPGPAARRRAGPVKRYPGVVLRGAGSPRAVAFRGSGVGVICEDEGEDLHRSAAPGTGQRVDLVDAEDNRLSI